MYLIGSQYNIRIFRIMNNLFYNALRVVIGRSSSSNGDVSTNMGQSDFWLVKLDSNGNLQWQKTFVLSAARRLCRAWTHARTAGV